MTLEGVRRICLSFPGATEDIKWGQDVCFSVGGKMFVAMNAEPPYQIGFKCAPETFAELTEREGIIPAPYLARAGWVQEEALGSALGDREFDALLRAAYDLVVERLPKSKRAGATAKVRVASRRRAAAPTRRRGAKSARRPPRRKA